MEELMQELFDREVPKKFKKIIEDFDGFQYPDSATPLLVGLPVNSKQMEEVLKEKIGGNTIFDLGCGRRPEGRGVAQMYDAKRYIGVDIRELFNKGEYYSSCDRGKREYYYFSEEDMLGFVSKLKNGIGGVYLLSALEIRKRDEHTNAYLDALVKEISRTLNKGDLVIFTGGSDDFFEILGHKYNFQLMTFPDEKNKYYPLLGTILYSKGGQNATNS